MAAPKVFISSTCFDLSEIREQLQKFVRSFGFDPVLSEFGDIFYHPDLHTHDACIYEVSNCQLFILIIGGRFGGHYTSDKTKSITNAEYDAAKKQRIPIFTYVRKGVLSSHHVYKQNKDKDFVNHIDYPSIEKKEHAIEIFKFIDEVRRAPTNNSIEGFDKFIDIETHLKKQWAGMFFDFLKNAEVKKQIDATNHLISGLTSSSTKLEELVKSLYREISTDNANATITSIEESAKVDEFYREIMLDTLYQSKDDLLRFPEGFDVDTVSRINPKNLNWDEYLLETGLFHIHSIKGEEAIEFHNNAYSYTLDEPPEYLVELFNKHLKFSTQATRADILRKLFKIVDSKKDR